MARQNANQAADVIDPVSNAVLTPEGSLFTRELLSRALANSHGASDTWKATAQALLANVLMNDYLNWWNPAFLVKIADAQDAIDQAMKLNPPDPVRALACNAQGLVHRAERTPQGQRAARDAFNQARQFDSGFARAHAQFGNQKSFLGRESEAHAPLDRARNLSPGHPASGYFYWAEGRAYFQETFWYSAIDWLTKSVDALQTVWYNRCYLAAAQDSAGDAANKAAAQQTMRNFINDRQFTTILARVVPSLQPNANDPPTVAAARQRVLDFVKPFLP